MTEQSARELLRRFGQFADQFSDCFNRRAQRDAASQYLDALFNDSERKSMQAMHGRLGDPGSYEALQHFITKTQAWARVGAWIDEYNRDRRQYALTSNHRSAMGSPNRKQHDLHPAKQ